MMWHFAASACTRWTYAMDMLFAAGLVCDSGCRMLVPFCDCNYLVLVLASSHHVLFVGSVLKLWQLFLGSDGNIAGWHLCAGIGICLMHIWHVQTQITCKEWSICLEHKPH